MNVSSHNGHHIISPILKSICKFIVLSLLSAIMAKELNGTSVPKFLSSLQKSRCWRKHLLIQLYLNPWSTFPKFTPWSEECNGRVEKMMGWGRIQDSYFKWELRDKTTPFRPHNPLQSWQKDVYIFNFKCLCYYLSLNWFGFQHCAHFPLELLNRLELYRLCVSLTMLYKI